MVHVAIDNHCAADSAVALQAPDGDSDIVDRAEPLAVIRERMMEAAADVETDAVFERQAGGQSRAAGGQPERLAICRE